MSDLEWLRGRETGRRAEDAERLKAAREKAGIDGKEPFDFRRLMELYDPSSELSSSSVPADSEAVARDLELKYYLDYRDAMTLEDFARSLARNRPFK